MTTNADFYEAFASSYEAYYANVDAQESVRQWLGYLENENLIPSFESRLSDPPLLLDLGCGPGWHLRPWKNASFEVYGLDSSPTMLRQAAKNVIAGAETDIPLYCADITQPECLTSLAGKFNIITGHFNFLNLFNAIQISSFFTSINLLLEQDGLFITDMASPHTFSINDRKMPPQQLYGWTRQTQQNNANNLVVLWERDMQMFVETFWCHQPEWLGKESELKGIQMIKTTGWYPNDTTSTWRKAAHAPQILLVFKKYKDYLPRLTHQ